MTDKELEICKRFKKIREKLGMKQGDFAKEIKLTQGHVSDIENGRKSVSDRVMEILYLKYNINEEWLRTGKGDMTYVKEKNQIIAEFSADLIKEPESFKTRFIEAMAKLDEKDWIDIERIFDKLVKKG